MESMTRQDTTQGFGRGEEDKNMGEHGREMVSGKDLAFIETGKRGWIVKKGQQHTKVGSIRRGKAQVSKSFTTCFAYLTFCDFCDEKPSNGKGCILIDSSQGK